MIEFVIAELDQAEETIQKAIDRIEKSRLERIEELQVLLLDAEKDGGNLDKRLAKEFKYEEKERLRNKTISWVRHTISQESKETAQSLYRKFIRMSAEDILAYTQGKEVCDMATDLRRDLNAPSISIVESEVLFIRCSVLLNSSDIEPNLASSLSREIVNKVEFIKRSVFVLILNVKDAPVKEALSTCVTACVMLQNLRELYVSLLYSGGSVVSGKTQH